MLPTGPGGSQVKQNIAKSISNWSTASQGRVEMEKYQGEALIESIIVPAPYGAGLCCYLLGMAKEVRTLSSSHLVP